MIASSVPFPSNRIPLDDAGKRDWIRLARSKNVGPVSFLSLLRRYQSASQAIDALPHIAQRTGSKKRIQLASMESVDEELLAGEKAGAQMLMLGASDYPPLLAQIFDPPPFLWAIGDIGLARRQCLSIVGARNASALGIRMARLLSRRLGEERYVIVSGLAYGIDKAAHEAAIDNGTVSVLAGGVDVAYPKEHKDLWHTISEKGLLLSEAQMGQKPTGHFFPRRNRVISGVSIGSIIVEAAERSGSLITARMALEQGREVMAVPGSPFDARSSGCNSLLRDGAILVRSANDVIEAITAFRKQVHIGESEAQTEPEETRITDDELSELQVTLRKLMNVHPIEIDELINITGAPTPLMMVALMEMELADLVVRYPGSKVSLAPPSD